MSVLGSKNSHAGQAKGPSSTVNTLRAFQDAMDEAISTLGGILATHK